MSPSQITYYDYHQPPLQDGHYTITVNQNLSLPNNVVEQSDIPATSIDFYVEGPRFNLDTSLIHSVFPPAGGKGDYRANLPTLVLNRSTLPWERNPAIGDLNTSSGQPDTPKPWLFLLLIDETETDLVTESNNVSLSDSPFMNPNLHPPSALVTQDEIQRLPSQINYLSIDPSLSGLLPVTLKRLQYLSYVRIKIPDDNNPLDVGEEHAVLLCNRLPQAGHASTVYLVSLEDNYSNNHPRKFMGRQISNTGPYYFPYFYKWQFHASDDQLYCVTADIAANLQSTYASLDLSSIYDQVFDNSDDFINQLMQLKITDATEQKAIQQAAKTKIAGGTFHELLSNLQGGFGPFAVAPQATDITSSGSVQLNFNKLEKVSGGTLPVHSATWYRGPLAAGLITLPSFPPAKQSEDLLLSFQNINDVSYSAAWELGRLTALNDVIFSTNFFKWKQEVAGARRLAALQTNPIYPNITHLSLADKGDTNLPLPQAVLDKFSAWRNLQGIPYRYLVSDPMLLPNESIRYFQVDANWVNAFISGAFSIGHTVSADLSDFESSQYLANNSTITGFLINSFAVSAWPDFELDIQDVNSQPLYPIRKDNLDTNIRIYLFNGKINQLSFHLHPGKMHPGFLYENGVYQKNGVPILATPNPNPDTNNVLHILQLATSLQAGSVSDFAAKIMQGTPEVIFTI